MNTRETNSNRRSPLTSIERTGIGSLRIRRRVSVRRLNMMEVAVVLGNVRKKMNLQKRFEDKYMPEPNSGCWLWTGSNTKGGHGRFWVKDKLEVASRFAYEFFKGPIYNKLHVLHRCDNPYCVNPEHLFLGTHKDNMADRDAKKRGVIPEPLFGEQHPTSKLTGEQVIKMRQIRDETKLSYTKLGTMFNVTTMTAYRACKGINWGFL